MSLQFVAPRRVFPWSLRQVGWIAVFCLSFGSTVLVHGQDNILAGANGFDGTKQIDNPWGGVNDGVLTVLPGTQKAVNDAGAITPSNPGPSIAVGDLNGDNLPDLVIADAKGFFWFYPNSGTPTEPKFTHGEVMPIWVANPAIKDKPRSEYRKDESEENPVPRFQLVDFDKDGKLDLVIGNYEGKLYYVRNIGSSRQPNFVMPQNLDTIMVPTYSRNLLWCNFLAPYLYDWRGNGILDLIMGEGTYASNSVYLLTNKGSNQGPTYNEMNTVKIIPGLGREHLTPQVVDWNHDGKPDIITGERLGFINIFLNTTTDPSHPQFDAGEHVKFGSTENLGPFATASVGDLTNNKLPNLLLSCADNKLLYAENKGTLGSPQFGTPLPIKGTPPFPKIFSAPANWMIYKALGIPYVQLCCSNAQVDPDFKPPSPEIKSVLRYYTVPHQNTTFPVGFYPQEDTQMIAYATPGGRDYIPVVMKPKTHYTLSFWVRNTGDISNFIYCFSAEQGSPRGGAYVFWLSKPISSSASWSHYTDDITYELHEDGAKADSLGFRFFIAFNGHPTVEFADFELKEQAH